MNDVEPSGWLNFAGILLICGGLMKFLDSLWAFRYHGALPDNLQNADLGSNLKTYAWVWLIVGIILVVAGFGVVVRSQIFRWIGIVAAAVGIVTTAVWLPYFPIWSLVYILLGAFVIYALAMHGGREATT